MLDWPLQPWYANVVRLVAVTPWRLPLGGSAVPRTDLSLCFMIAGIDCLAVKSQVLRDRGLSGVSDPYYAEGKEVYLLGGSTIILGGCTSRGFPLFFVNV